MAKFKIGDKVVVTNAYYDFKKEFNGEIVTINELDGRILHDNKQVYKVLTKDGKQHNFVFTEGELELATKLHEVLS